MSFCVKIHKFVFNSCIIFLYSYNGGLSLAFVKGLNFVFHPSLNSYTATPV
jgi:hypothetical protein